MKKFKTVNVITLFFLLLVIQIMVSANIIFRSPQAQGTSPDLLGTEWLVTVKDFYSAYNFDSVWYRFDKNGTVELSVARIVPKPLPPRPLHSLEIENIPVIAKRSLSGTFQRKGNSIHIEFSDHTIDAIINGSRMTGEIRSKDSDRTSKWAAEKASTPSNARGKDLLLKADELKRQGKYSEAVESYSAAIRLAPDGTDMLLAISGRGDSRLGIKDYRGAIADYNQFIEIRWGRTNTGLAGLDARPEDLSNDLDYRVLNNRGVAKYELGDKARACEDFSWSCEWAKTNRGTEVGCESLKRVCD